MEVIQGEWIEGESAGGSRNDIHVFATNPQYLLTLTEPGECFKIFTSQTLEYR